jgi:CRP-like cAMP-binding protein
MLTVVEKVIFLQAVDIFEHIRTRDIAHLAAIAEQIEYDEGDVLYAAGDRADAMYVVMEGEVRLERDGSSLMTANPREAFGVWALFDEEMRVATALSTKRSEVLKIDRDDFFDLLADHVQITQGILKSIVRRLRSLMGAVDNRIQPAATR